MRFWIGMLFLAGVCFGEIVRYEPLSLDVWYQGRFYHAFRLLEESSAQSYLAFDHQTLQTQKIPLQEAKIAPGAALEDSLYKKMMREAYKPPRLLANDGLKSFGGESHYLSVDLCPSRHKGFEERLWTLLEARQKTFPVIVCVSGRWMDSHKEEWAALIQKERQGSLEILWCNHTYDHFYEKNLPLERNFLRHESQNLSKEVLQLEKRWLKEGILPGPFFRFPGLISSPSLMQELQKLGLIPLGAQAWMAKGEIPQKGGIILLHGNLNEPLGIDLFEQFLEENQGAHFGGVKEMQN